MRWRKFWHWMITPQELMYEFDIHVAIGHIGYVPVILFQRFHVRLYFRRSQ